jgi:transcriptional regulator with XRE-family HTH domain
MSNIADPSNAAEPIIKFVCRHLELARGRWTEVARRSGVPYDTLTKIAQGKVTNPRIETVQRLVDYFNRPSAEGLACTEPVEAKAA